MERLVDIDVDAVGLKAKSKKELYDMISGLDGVYLLPLKTEITNLFSNSNQWWEKVSL